MNRNQDGPVVTYFEVMIHNEVKKHTSSLCLSGRSEIFRFCKENKIPIQDENQIITFHVRKNPEYRSIALPDLVHNMNA